MKDISWLNCNWDYSLSVQTVAIYTINVLPQCKLYIQTSSTRTMMICLSNILEKVPYTRYYSTTNTDPSSAAEARNSLAYYGFRLRNSKYFLQYKKMFTLAIWHSGSLWESDKNLTLVKHVDTHNCLISGDLWYTFPTLIHRPRLRISITLS